jgi:hypothetical protein
MKNYLHSLIIGMAVIFTALILAGAFKNRNRNQNTISVTGLGSKDFVSDLIVWSGSFSKKNANLKDAYAELDKDRASIQAYLVSKGLKESDMVFSAVSIRKEFEDVYDNNGTRIKSIFAGYALTQSVEVESKEVDKVENISRQVSELINSGVEFYSESPNYYYTKLAELKIEMIAAATKDANVRAQKIAENADASVGSLKNADMGVFQITGQNSAEEYSWGGSFNTSSKKKTATITVKLDYETN